MSQIDSAVEVQRDQPLMPPAPSRRPGSVRGLGFARMRRNWPAYLLILPLLAVSAVVFVYPILRMLGSTLTEGDSGSTFLGIHLDAFKGVFGDSFSRGIVYRTIRVAAIATFVDLVLAFPLTLWMRQLRPRTRGVMVMLLLSPLLMNVVVRSLGWVMLLGPGGLLGEVTSKLGLGSHSVMYSEPAISIGLAQVFLGFMVLSQLTSALKIPEDLIWASFNLGANSWEVMRKVAFPLMVPGMIAGVSIVFPLAAGDYAIPALLGGNRLTLGTRVYQEAMLQLNYNEAAALAVVLFVIICVVSAGLALATRAIRKSLQV